MASLNGAVVSDGLADGRVISGVGGQYNFVAMAHQLPSGRSLLMVRSVRGAGADAQSNIVGSYGHCTIPRHLRDLLITEYGIADLRSQTDAECVRRILRITDARFQEGLLAQAKAAGKIESDFQIPQAWKQNTPESLERWLQAARQKGLFPAFPLGTELTEQEIRLGGALKAIKAKAASTPRWRLLLKGLRAPAKVEGQLAEDLQRLGLTEPQGLEAKISRALLVEALGEGSR